MSRSPGGFASSDIRSSAILQDHLNDTDPCTPGAEIQSRCGRTYIADCGVPPCGFDRPKYFIMALMAMLIVAVTIGLLNCSGLYIPLVEVAYGMGFVEICFVAGLTYLIMIKVSCLGCYLIAWIGHRQTALFGMVIMFIGIVLDAFTIHVATFYVAHLLFFAIGAGLAYCSAMSLIGDLFRKYLSTAKLIVSIGSCLGTIFFLWFNLFLLKHVSYKWTKLCMALIVIIFTGATHLFPNFIIDADCGIGTTGKDTAGGKSNRDKEIKDCVKKAAQKDQMKKPPTNHKKEKSMLCVCVCDIALWSDWSFVLWGVCILIATMALFVPYMYILAFADTIPIILSPWYITALCLGSMIGRLGVLLGYDFTFGYNRTLYVLSVVASGILWICLPYVETFGWVIIWSGIMGIVEGLIVTCIPRLTLLTMPKKWIESSWGLILWFHALGIFIVTVFVALVARSALDFMVAFTTIGIIQIIGGLMGFLLPNEEDCENNSESDCEDGGKNGALSARNFVQFPFTRNPCADLQSYYKPRNYNASGCYELGSSFKSSYNENNGGQKNNGLGTSYSCDCPICKAAGCFPECPGCIPGGLAGVSSPPPKSAPSKGSDGAGKTGGGTPSKATPSKTNVGKPEGPPPPSSQKTQSPQVPSSPPSKTGDLVPPPPSQIGKLEPPLAPPSRLGNLVPAPPRSPYYPSSRGLPPNAAPSKSNLPKDEGVVKRTTYEIKKTKNMPN